MIEPLLRCRCRRTYREADAHVPKYGRHKYSLVFPGCGHPLSEATYIDPRTGQVLIPYATDTYPGIPPSRAGQGSATRDIPRARRAA